MLIESIINRHPCVLAKIFVPHTISALLRHQPLPRTDYQVSLRSIPSGIRAEVITLDSKDLEALDSAQALPRTLQTEDITEYGAIGLAFLYVAEYTDLQVVEVTQRRERADYWIGPTPGDKHLLLEVSGIDNGSHCDLQNREEEKVQQVRKHSRYAKPFIVAICEFRNGLSIFSKNEMKAE